MTSSQRMWLARLALCLNLAGSLALFYSFKIVEAPLMYSTKMPFDPEGKTFSGIDKNRSWLIRPGIVCLMVGFGIQLGQTWRKPADSDA